jgi:hypothetical protein
MAAMGLNPIEFAPMRDRMVRFLSGMINLGIP